MNPQRKPTYVNSLSHQGWC